MNIKHYYSKAALLAASLGIITALQSCSKNKSIIPGSTEDKNLFGSWKRTLPRTAKGDSVQTIAFYQGTFSTLRVDVYATPSSAANSTLYRGVYDTDGTAVYFKLNQKQDSPTDINGNGTPVSDVLFNTIPYKIDTDTLKVTNAGTVMKFVRVNQ